MTDRGQKPTFGQITNDPAAKPMDGDTLTFKPIGVKLLDEDTTVFMQSFDAFEGTVLSFHFANSSEHVVEGSAVMVGPGMALAAKHVIEPHIDRLVMGEMRSMCIGAAKNGMNIWTVRQVTMLENSDIVILGLELNSSMPKDRTFNQTVVSTRLPKVGDRVQIVGFRANSASVSLDSDKHCYDLDAMLLVSAGVVNERYPQGRDSVMLPWPVLEVDCPSWGGMSGGPVFDEHGHLIGILCSSFSDENGNGMSYASLLWPALTVKFEGGWPGQAFQGKRALLDLDPRIFPIQRRESISSIFDEVTGQVKTQYSPWE